MVYKNVPGRGLMSKTAYELRLEFFKNLVKNHAPISASRLQLEDVQNNIESFIGGYEIPVGLAGPLLFNFEEQQEWVYTGVGTSEGALVASMNRGAKAISECGGVNAHFVHQKMLRAPLFTFLSMADAYRFDSWVRRHFDAIKEQTEKHSNHAELLEIVPVIIGRLAHLKFIFTTGDASGQNMVTHCTWQACLWIVEQLEAEEGLEIVDFYVEGNSASDKKVSFYSLQGGRGVHVVSECFLSEEIIQKTLRTNSEQMFRLYNYSMSASRYDGMIGGNVNIANTIAAIFAATGQDLACIHESAVGILQMDKTDGGLYLSLSLPCLVVGTFGGGTGLPGAKTMLELMGCYGNNKIKRFAEIIAGYALSLEISTLAALASGQFARAHQKLGKNKAVDHLHRSEINTDFLRKIAPEIHGHKLVSVTTNTGTNNANGILSNIVQRISRKVTGFIPLTLHTENQQQKALIKSKPLDSELIKGLHYTASCVSSDLADLLLRHKNTLEYKDTHRKEIDVCAFLQKRGYRDIPAFYGQLQDKRREIYLFLLEDIETGKTTLINSEDKPEAWTTEHISQAIRSIHQVHQLFAEEHPQELAYIPAFEPMANLPLYVKSNEVNRRDYTHWHVDELFDKEAQMLKTWEMDAPQTRARKTLVHNDFNTRNVAIRNNGQLCIYDWELAMLNIPQRDIAEFLAFCLLPAHSANELMTYLQQHWQLMADSQTGTYSFRDYLEDFEVAAQEFILCRVSFYLASNTLADYSFIERVFRSAHQMLNHVSHAL